MRRRRCSLCGGKLVKNRCVECGLDNAQNDERYKNRVNKSVCDDKPMTHVHEEVKPNVTQKMDIAKGITLFLTIGSLALGAWGTIKDAVFEPEFEGWQEEAVYEDQDPYEFVTRELLEDGEIYEIVLEPGNYQVGVHIPEGTYLAVPEEGYEEYINLRDEQNGIYYFIDFGDYEGAVWEQDDVRLYDGANLEVPTRMKVKLYSENAQISQMHGTENSITQEVMIQGNAMAGREFEPGMYDISFVPEEDEQDEYGKVTYTPSIEDMENGIFDGTIYFDEYWGAETFHNVWLPEGTTVVVEGLKEIKLTPSIIVE